MKMKKYMIKTLVLGSPFIVFILVTVPLYADENKPVGMITPKPATLQIERKPVLRFTYQADEQPDELTVLLDGNDISELVRWHENGFTCRLFEPIPAGEHTVSISGRIGDEDFSEEFSFSSRQYAWLDEAASTNTVTFNAGAVLAEKDMAETDPYTSINVTLNHSLSLKKNNWHLDINADGRYMEQDTGLEYPEKKGPDLINFLLSTGYETEKSSAVLEIGDLTIEQSPSTFTSLSRNGGRLELASHGFKVGGFAVFGKETFGLRQGVGIGFDQESNIMGGYGGADLLDDRIHVKVFYASGGREGDSYSNWSDEAGGSRGDVAGVLLQADIMDNLLGVEMEYDASAYDADTGDAFGTDDDEAWRVAFNGSLDIYEYEVAYEYYGDRYKVVGNEGAQKDYAGVTTSASASWPVHFLGLEFAAYRDNVDDDPLVAVTHSFNASVEYEYSGFERYPIRMRYEHTRDRSTDEPEPETENDLFTDLVGCSIGYSGDLFSVELISEYSWQNDKTGEDQDQSALSLSLNPSFDFDLVRANMTIGLKEDKDYGADNRNDAYTVTLDLQGNLFEDQISYELGGTYDRDLASDDSRDGYSSSGYFRIAYYPGFTFLEEYRPSLGLEMQYSKQTDRLNDSFTEDSRIMLTLTTEVSFDL
jgi:hypothetical protein